MTAIPDGFELEKPERKVAFTFAPGTPPEVIAATHAYAANDATPPSDGVDIPPGFEKFSPGVGSTAPDPRIEQIRMQEEIDRSLPNNPLENFLVGNRYGIKSTALGTGQLAAHLMNPGGQPTIGALGLPNPNALDAAVSRFGAERRADPAMQTTAGNMGEFSGGMIATAPLMGASIPAKGAPLLSWLSQNAAGGALASATQPVYGGDFAAEKLQQAGTGAAFGVGVPAGLRGLMAAGERMYTPNAMAQLANVANKGANAKPFAQEGEDLAARTGVRMTPGQVSGSKVQTALENMSRQSIFSADKAFEADQRVAGDAVRYVNRIMDNISKNPASEASVGTQIQAATRASVAKIAARREEVAAAEYGALDVALGGRKFVRPQNAMAEADAIIGEYSAVATPEAQRIVRQAEAMKEQLRAGGDLSFSQAQKSRTYYGRGARGATNVFDDVNPDINRRIAARIFKAFDADIEQSSARLESGSLGPGLVPPGFFKGQVGPGGGNIAGAIKRANANYRRYSQLIDATEKHPIARLFGDNIKIDDVVQFDKIAPEVVIDRLGKMKPTELQMVRGFMEQQAPEAWQQYKRLLVERALDSAQTLPTSMGANVVPFNASAFVRALGGDKPERIRQLQAVFGAKELRELDDAFRVARRLGDNFGRNNSGTGPYMEAMRFFDSLKARSAQALASSGGEALGLRKIANVMLSSDGRRALVELSRLPPGSRQAASLLGVIAGLASGQSAVRGNDYGRGQHP